MNEGGKKEPCGGTAQGFIQSNSHNHITNDLQKKHNHEIASTYEKECLEHLNRASVMGVDPLIGFPAPEGWEPEVEK
jgi:hypothetical protein|nr:MAG TPA: hypothetical protein [Caudoviricetes sp.]